jgi:predicted amidophosphoribosyltransferase
VSECIASSLSRDDNPKHIFIWAENGFIVRGETERSIYSQGWDMKETALSRCDVCGSFAGASGCCEICGTILVEGKVQCGQCGDPLQAYAMVCYSCGTKRNEEASRERSGEEKEAIERFTLVPGVSQETASDLVEEGVEDLATLVGMSLTDKLRDRGLHHVIARRMMLMDVLDGNRDEEIIEEMECPICKSIIDASSEACEICGHYTRIKLESSDEGAKRLLDPEMGQIHDKITWDAAFREMPTDFQEELSRVLIEADDSDLLDIEENDEDGFWDELDSDLEELEKATEKTPEPEKTVMICPLCEAEVIQDAHYCYNCGAHFEEA